MGRAVPLAATVVLLVLALAPGAHGAALEDVGSFESPIYVTSDPADSGRLLVAGRQGVIVEARGQTRTTWADLRGLALCCESERGLLSIAPAPDFHESDRVFVAYTGEASAGGSPGDIHLDAFQHAGGALLRERLLTVPHSTQGNHNSGQLQFGPDGYLYMTVGDGGGGDDPFDSGQDLDTLLGKLLRIEPHPGASPAYGIPPGNPFSGSEGRDEIWAYGLRNAWRFSFDRATGDLVIADVGQGAREEIDFSPAPGLGVGANYGWDCREGLIAHTVDPSPACEGAGGFSEPVFDYPHGEPEEEGEAHGCSIIGGFVMRDPGVAALEGRYLYSDLCTAEVRSIQLSTADPRATDRAEPELSPPSTVYSFGEDSCGRVYLATQNGNVFRVVGDQPTGCPAPAPPVEPAPGSPAGGPGESSSQAKPPAGSRGQPASARTRIVLRAVRRHARVVGLMARVKPCAGNRGRRLLLRRGGRSYAAKGLSGRCLARFRLRPRRRETFRALLRLGAGHGAVRSRRVVVLPSSSRRTHHDLQAAHLEEAAIRRAPEGGRKRP